MSKGNCDHILGVSISKLLNEDGTQRLEWKDEITASRADWKGDGIINMHWTGSKYRFCPLCGTELGGLSMGFRASSVT